MVNRMVAMETQARMNHDYVGQLAGTIQALTTSLEYERRRGDNLEVRMNEFQRLGFDLNQEVHKIKATVESRHEDAPNISAKIAIIEATLVSLQSTVAKAGTAVEQNVAEVEKTVTALQEVKPAEGAVISATFRQQSQEIHAMKEALFKTPIGIHTGTSVEDARMVPFTEEMRQSMEKMYLQFGNLTRLSTSMPLVNGRLDALENVAAVTNGRMDVHDLRLDEIETTPNTHCESPPPPPPALNLCGAYMQSSGCGCCDGSHAPPPPPPGPNPWAAYAPRGTGTPGLVPSAPIGGGGAAGAGATLRAVIGGNNKCHCEHVEDLLRRVHVLETTGRAHPQNDPLPDPWNGSPKPAEDTPGGDARRGPDRRQPPMPFDSNKPLELLEPLGTIGAKDKLLFDDKIATTPEYQFNGQRNGLSWVRKVENHFISRAPVLLALLLWAEECEDSIDVTRVMKVAGHKLTEEQIRNVNASMWGFLSACVSGPAETIFKRAKTLQGIDAWRVLTRYVNHGKRIRLNRLRDQVMTVRNRPIASVEKIEEGVAEFENLFAEYELAGGVLEGDDAMKSDLLKILPSDVRKALLWNADDEGSFEKFRDMVVTQSLKILENEKKLPNLQGVSEQGPSSNDQSPPHGITFNSNEEMIMAFQKWQSKNNNGQQQQRQPPKGDQKYTNKRRCPNCGGENCPVKCPKPPVDIKDRPCWHCGQKGHRSAQCPTKGRTLAIEDIDKSTGEALRSAGIVGAVSGNPTLNGFYNVEDAQFKTAKKPTPSKATLGSFIRDNSIKTSNRFAALSPGPTGTGTTGVDAPTGRKGSSGEVTQTVELLL